MLEWLVCLFTSTFPFYENFYLLSAAHNCLGSSLNLRSIALLKVSLTLLEYIGYIVEKAKDFGNFYDYLANFFKFFSNKKKFFI